MSDTGRAGRVRLERRLQTARNGAALLDRKQRILADELDRLQLHADAVGQEWKDRAQEALTWLRRTAALDGQTLIDQAAPTDPAEIEISWGGAMGVTYPEDAHCHLPDPRLAGGTSALSYAANCHRAALSAAVKQAAVERATLMLSTELSATHTRKRAVENRWIPQLEDELTALRRKIEDQELEESLRVHWAAHRTKKLGGPSASTSAPQGVETS